MSRVAAVDCGTNSIRLLVADVEQPPGEGRPRLSDVVRRMEIVRLGQDVDRTGRLAPEALERTRLALTDYAKQIGELGAERVRMVATSATRDAANRSDFTAMVVETLGVEPEVITGDEEAQLSFSGAVLGAPGDSPYLVVDIGGGSTEFVLGNSTVESSLSIDVGCVRLTERHLHSDPANSDEIGRAEADIRVGLELVRAAVPVEKANTFLGLAGSVTTVAGIALGLSAYDPTAIHHSRIPVSKVRSVTAGLLTMTRAQRAAIPVMHSGRVDVIGAGALVLRVIMDAFALDEVLVSEHDILDGIALSCLG